MDKQPLNPDPLNGRKASIEEMKMEAAARMKSLGIRQECIDAFLCEDYVIPFFRVVENKVECMWAAEENPIIELEKDHDKLVWAVIHDHDFEDGEEWNYYLHFFVTNDPENWPEERKELENREVTVYLAIIPEETSNKQFGYTQLKITVKDGMLLPADL